MYDTHTYFEETAIQTKTKLTVTIDSEVLPRAKEYARAHGVSLSALIEEALRDALEAEAAPEATSWAAGKTDEEIAAHLPFETEAERVTRNVRDFDRSPIPILSPADALAELSR